ncbi:MAG: hypothetical protein AAGF94_05265 [Pseudomonadota bacterium]
MTEKTTEVIMLDGLRVPEGSPILRRHVRPPERRTAIYTERFDRRTLFYDAVALAGQDAVLLTAPRFLNLWPILRDGLRRDGRRLPRHALHRRTYLRCEQVLIKHPGGALSLEMMGHSYEINVRRSGQPLFAGRRVVMAVNKNNDLEWVRDWARFHAHRHRADGVLIFDNGSTSYTPDALAENLADMPELARAVVIAAPFPYGPADKGGRFDVPPRFFQTAMFNLARRDLVANAASVLSVDIDELVDGPQGESIFAAAEMSRLGMVTFPGIWTFPAPGTEGPAPQRTHVFQPPHPDRCHQKWCIAPAGPMGRVAWNVHKLGGPLQPLFTMSRKFRLLHCRAASTGWKPDRFLLPGDLQKDAEISALFKDAFGEEA